MNKKVFYNVIFAVLILFICFNFFILLPLHNTNSSGEPAFLNKAYTVSSTDKVLTVNEKMILVANRTESVYQCFDYDGKFLWGVKMPYSKQVGSTLYSFDKEYVYIWSASLGKVFVFNESGLVREVMHEDIEDAGEFYERYPIDAQNVYPSFSSDFKLDGSLRISSGDKQLLNIKLQAPYNYYTPELAVVLIVVCIVGCFILKKKI